MRYGKNKNYFGFCIQIRKIDQEETFMGFAEQIKVQREKNKNLKRFNDNQF